MIELRQLYAICAVQVVLAAALVAFEPGWIKLVAVVPAAVLVYGVVAMVRIRRMLATRKVVQQRMDEMDRWLHDQQDL